MEIPRIRGKVGQVDGGESNGKWVFQVWMVPLGGGECTDENSLGVFGPFETKELAQDELKAACKLACEKWEEIFARGKSGKFINMKNNRTEEWEKK